MKNKIFISFIILIILVSLNTICYGKETGTIYLESNQDVVEIGDEVEITVNVKNSEIAAFNISFNFDNNKWEYVSKLDNANVKDNHILYVWYDENGGNSAKQSELVKFKFKSKEKGLSTFSVEGDFYNQLRAIY